MVVPGSPLPHLILPHSPIALGVLEYSFHKIGLPVSRRQLHERGPVAALRGLYFISSFDRLLTSSQTSIGISHPFGQICTRVAQNYTDTVPFSGLRSSIRTAFQRSLSQFQPTSHAPDLATAEGRFVPWGFSCHTIWVVLTSITNVLPMLVIFSKRSKLRPYEASAQAQSSFNPLAFASWMSSHASLFLVAKARSAVGIPVFSQRLL